jgi:hypothetical protein
MPGSPIVSSILNAIAAAAFACENASFGASDPKTPISV